MTRIKQSLAAFILISFSAISSYGQRTCDVELILDAPQDGAVFTVGDPIPVKLTIKNNGPDPLQPGDNIHIMNPKGTVDIFIPNVSFVAGESLIFIDETVPATLSGSVSWTGDYCYYIRYIPMAMQFIDPDSINNRVCKTITIKPKGTSIGKQEKESLTIYPNPTSNEVTIDHDGFGMAAITILVSDITGRKVMHIEHNKQPLNSATSLNLNVQQLRAGVYFVELRTGDRKALRKLIIQK